MTEIALVQKGLDALVTYLESLDDTRLAKFAEIYLDVSNAREELERVKFDAFRDSLESTFKRS